MGLTAFINRAAKAIVAAIGSGVAAATIYVESNDIQLDTWKPWAVGLGVAFGNGLFTYFATNTVKGEPVQPIVVQQGDPTANG